MDFLLEITDAQAALITALHDEPESSRCFATATAERWLTWFRDAYKVTESHGTRCPRRLVGKRCHAHHYGDKACACERMHRALDHVQLWNHQSKPAYLTSQPYYLDMDALKPVCEVCTELGLRYWIDSRSFYFPSQTLLLVIAREELIL